MISFFEWLKLNEMALGHTFNPEKSGYFSGNDQKIVGQMFPKIKSKLKSFLKKLDFVTIHMYFGIPPVMAFGDSGEQFVKKLRQYFFDGETFYGNNLGIKIPKSDIVFVKQGTFADSLSPWMILHTFAHAAIDSVIDGTFINVDFGNFQRPALEKAVWSAIAVNRKLKNLGVGESLLYIFFPMGSLRKSIKMNKGEKVQKGFELNDNELFREMFVYYLTKGGKIPIPSDYKEKLAGYGKSESEVSEILASIQELSDAFKNILEACRGDVLTDSRSY
jgi:hypothetical protein